MEKQHIPDCLLLRTEILEKTPSHITIRIQRSTPEMRLFREKAIREIRDRMKYHPPLSDARIIDSCGGEKVLESLMLDLALENTYKPLLRKMELIPLGEVKTDLTSTYPLNITIQVPLVNTQSFRTNIEKALEK